MGAMGYFPTYTLGSLLAAQLHAAAVEALGGSDAVNEQVARGDFGPLLNWLRTHVHRHGGRFGTEALCRQACGAPLSSAALAAWLDAG